MYLQIWAALTSLGEADIAAILSGDLSALRLPRVGHMEVYVPAILRDPNGALLNSVDTPVELQKVRVLRLDYIAIVKRWLIYTYVYIFSGLYPCNRCFPSVWQTVRFYPAV
jgi:hypothetical protein